MADRLMTGSLTAAGVLAVLVTTAGVGLALSFSLVVLIGGGY